MWDGVIPKRLWQDVESQITIKPDWDEDSGLPASYSVEEIEQKAEAMYFHIFQVYRDAQPTIYAEAAWDTFD